MKKVLKIKFYLEDRVEIMKYTQKEIEFVFSKCIEMEEEYKKLRYFFFRIYGRDDLNLNLFIRNLENIARYDFELNGFLVNFEFGRRRIYFKHK